MWVVHHSPCEFIVFHLTCVFWQAEKDHTIQQLKMQLAHELEEASTSRRELAETRETLGRERVV